MSTSRIVAKESSSNIHLLHLDTICSSKNPNYPENLQSTMQRGAKAKGEMTCFSGGFKYLAPSGPVLWVWHGGLRSFFKRRRCITEVDSSKKSSHTLLPGRFQKSRSALERLSACNKSKSPFRNVQEFIMQDQNKHCNAKSHT